MKVRQGPAESAADERLRRGRVSVRGEQLIKFEKAMRSSLSALNQGAGGAGTPQHPGPSHSTAKPTTADTFRIVAEYAKRGQEALSRYGLTQAD